MPSSFRTPLDARLVGPDTWELLTEFRYDIGHLGSAYTLVFPRGMMTDFLSIPWIAKWIISPTGKYAKAGVVHDGLYQSGTVSRIVADAMIVEAMRAIDHPIEEAVVNRVARLLVFLAVVMGGRVAWRKHRERALAPQEKR